MAKHTILSGAVLSLIAGPALADLTAEELWSDWQEAYGGFGFEVTGTTSKSGDTLTISDVGFAFDLGGLGRSQSNYGAIEMVEQPDGTIRLVLPATMEVSTVTNIEGVETTQTMTIETAGLEAIVTEDGDKRFYDISGDTITYLFDDLSSGEADAPVAGVMTMTGLASRYTVDQGDGAETLSFAQTLSADGMTLRVSSEGPEEVLFSYELSDLSADAQGSIPATPPADLETFNLAAFGMLMGSKIEHKGSTFNLDVQSADGPTNISGTSGAGSIGIDIGADTLGYTLSSQDSEIMAQVATLPVPINATMAEITTGFALPFGVGDNPKPFAVNIAYRELALDEGLWALFDPTGQLPRDPATLLLNLSGTAQMNVDLFGGDPDAFIGLQGPPGEVKTLELSQLDLSVAGAKLTGSGSLEFPTPGPIPQPVGKVTLALDGGLGLLDKLVALGFVPAEQAGFIKGMSGVVARPVGEDQLESEIEFTPGGGITANGLPLQ